MRKTHEGAGGEEGFGEGASIQTHGKWGGRREEGESTQMHGEQMGRKALKRECSHSHARRPTRDCTHGHAHSEHVHLPDGTGGRLGPGSLDSSMTAAGASTTTPDDRSHSTHCDVHAHTHTHTHTVITTTPRAAHLTHPGKRYWRGEAAAITALSPAVSLQANAQLAMHSTTRHTPITTSGANPPTRGQSTRHDTRRPQATTHKYTRHTCTTTVHCVGPHRRQRLTAVQAQAVRRLGRRVSNH